MKTNIILAVVIVVIVLVAGWWFLQKKPQNGQASKQGGSTNNTNATLVTHFVPALPAGQQQSGDCFASSIAAYPRTDAWRCNVNNEIFDPCFSVAQADTVVCGADPLSGSGGFALLLKKPLPAATPATGILVAWGWVVQLSDGTVCAPFTGTRAQVNGKTTTYGCKPATGNANVVILGDLDSSKPLWTAQVATISFSDSQIHEDNVQTLSVTKVWQ